MTATVALALTAAAVTAVPASAAPLSAHGQLLHLAPGLRANANSSSNWFGYNQGALEQGGKLFNSISGDWTVPTATQHTSGQAEASSDWIGIGGGCIDSGCTATDSTLIQTGTEQDVSSTGAPSYSAWYELVPAPSLTISSITVHPGDQMHASVSQVANDVDAWDITINDVTTGQSYSTTLPYPSTMGTAEWIEETPLEIGTNAGFAALPNLTNPAFTSGTVNASPVKLSPSEEMDLTDSSGAVIGAPSAPNSAGSGFDACAWASSCS
ncbi:MAG TPA: G1 family glutamic endopeptidase [Solirubrobacteraceae bacterium]|nr:G1 family glutamic endopeptidase [Solirubrobacteraceae bacterium]